MRGPKEATRRKGSLGAGKGDHGACERRTDRGKGDVSAEFT